MPRVVKMTITLPENLAHLIEQVMVANNLDRSSAVAFMLSRVNQKDLFPPPLQGRNLLATTARGLHEGAGTQAFLAARLLYDRILRFLDPGVFYLSPLPRLPQPGQRVQRRLTD